MLPDTALECHSEIFKFHYQQEGGPIMKVSTCGINLAKNVFCHPWSRLSWSNQFAQEMAVYFARMEP